MRTADSRFAGVNANPAFSATHWSVVLAARQEDSQDAAAALEQLCRRYWYPLYAYVRRKGYSPEDAQDLTQQFFARLIARHYLQDVHPAKGKFRSFLLACLNHFLAKEWRKGQTQSRGSGAPHLSLDETAAEGRYRLERADDSTPERLYERRWALTLLEHAETRLREACAAEGKAEMFEALKGCLTGDRQSRYAEIADQLHLTEPAVRKSVQRLRARYGESLRAVVAETVAKPQEVEDEIRYLFTILRG